MDILLWHIAGLLGACVLLPIAFWGAVAIAEELKDAAFKRTRRRIDQQWVLVDAASDRDALEGLVREGADLNQRAGRGDTALHRAYLIGNTEAVTNLENAGAAKDLANSEGLLPHEMAAVAYATALIGEGVALITDDGWYADAQEGRRIWSALRAVSRKHYYVALDRALPLTADRLGRKYALVAIKVGQPSTEKILLPLLKVRGPGVEQIATDFLNSGNGTLRTEAERWALANDYRIVRHTRGGSVTWGSS